MRVLTNITCLFSRGIRLSNIEQLEQFKKEYGNLMAIIGKRKSDGWTETIWFSDSLKTWFWLNLDEVNDPDVRLETLYGDSMSQFFDDTAYVFREGGPFVSRYSIIDKQNHLHLVEFTRWCDTERGHIFSIVKDTTGRGDTKS
jgi:hypothetical protein